MKGKLGAPLPHLEMMKWDIGPDYKAVTYLGKGAYGMVCKALHVPSGRYVAIKKMTLF
jgi:mitogen-activated protein kinase 1/3